MRIFAVAALAVGIGVMLTPQSKGQPEPTSFQAQEQQHTQTHNSSEDQKKDEIEIEREIGRYTGWLVLVGVVQFLALIVQAIVFIQTLRQMQDTDRRQLRAYVLCESGFIFNVANPVPIFPGQVF